MNNHEGIMSSSSNSNTENRIVITKLTPKKFFETTLLILNEERTFEKNSPQVKLLLGSMKSEIISFQEKYEEKNIPLHELKKFEKVLMHLIKDISCSDKECGELLKTMMKPAFNRLKKQSSETK